jgi:hypothetical protein
MKLTPNIGDYRRHKAGQPYEANIVWQEIQDGDYGLMILWTLKGPEIEPDTKLVSSTTLSKKSKLGKWVQLIFPDYDFSDTFDTDLLLGQPVLVTFEHTETDGGGWNEKGSVVARGSLPKIDIATEQHPDEAPF